MLNVAVIGEDDHFARLLNKGKPTMRWILIFVISVSTFSYTRGQDVISTLDLSNSPGLPDSIPADYRDRWQYISLDSSIAVKIVKRWPATTPCGVICNSSLTIVATSSGELMRVLGLCDTSTELQEGQMVKVVPTIKIEPINSCLPNYGMRRHFLTRELIVHDIPGVLKTTWGELQIVK